ncbi:hypothetical protein ACFODZ_08625 [Marinicella sediminis]|uniref:Integrase catalytic domain-containing protein n=1 Tax=Marinicella sediminis TaxID=1792834 RepID=A0ABV7JDZ9_9GAMM|nr:hypothetical protein [Marinicella sediminis]
MSWKKRLMQNPSLKDINTWPGINIIDLPRDKNKKFIRNKIIVSRVMLGEKISDVSRDVNVTRQFISYLLNRCLAGLPYEEPSLTSGLIPQLKILGGERKTRLSVNNDSGARGAFQYILKNHADIKVRLDAMIKAFVSDSVHGQNLSPAVVHKKFLELLIEKHWPSNQYPFDQQNLAVESCRKYFHKQSQCYLLAKARKRAIIPLNKPQQRYCFEEVEIDSQLMDINCNVVVDVDGVQSTLRVARLALLLAIDVESNCILAYHVCLSKEPNQYDLLSLLVKIHSEWKPRDICLPNTQYEPGACLPGAISNEMRRLGIGKLKLDNAMAHHAYSIIDYVCGELDSTLNYGLPANPKTRNSVEYAFNRLNKYLHRFKSTTGSNPKDPKKESLRHHKKPPMLNIKELEDFLSIIFTGHNIQPQNVLGGKNPLEVLHEHYQQYPLQLNYKAESHCRSPFERIEKVKVYGYKHERRTPVVQFSGMRYRGPGINDVQLYGEKVIILVNVKDIRTVKASTESGKYLGELFASKSWQKYPLSLKTYQKIKRVVKRQRLLTRDYQSGYFESLLNEKHVPNKALEIIRVAREFQSEAVGLKNQNLYVKPLRNKPSKLTRDIIIKPWDVSMFNNTSDRTDEQ